MKNIIFIDKSAGVSADEVAKIFPDCSVISQTTPDAAADFAVAETAADSVKDLRNYVVLTSSAEIYREKTISNNVVNTAGMGFDTVVKQIEWVLSGFGMNSARQDDIYIIGDPHFWHKNIIRYCGRPWRSGKDEAGNPVPTDDDVLRMNEDMISYWNSVITSKSQIVYVNGDFCFGNKTKMKSITERLNGRKRLILGNHDKCRFSEYLDAGFERVYDKPIILEDFCIVSHMPMQWVKDGDVFMNVYAHVHNQEMYRDYTANSFCTSAERIGYRPIALSEIFEKCKAYSERNEN